MIINIDFEVIFWSWNLLKVTFAPLRRNIYIKSKIRNLNLIKACYIHTYYINTLIHEKQFHLYNLQNHVSFYRINKQLQNSNLQKKIINLQNKIEQ
jgi:hypothetical protein